MSHAFNFADLTPDLQLDALQSIGFYADSGLLALNSYENRVYQFRADDGKRFVAKFYRPERWSDAQILEEHQFALDLVTAEVPVVAPIARDGVTLHHFSGYRFALFPSCGGRPFEMDNLDQFEQLGRYLGMLHQVGSQRPFQARPQIDLRQDIARASQQLLQSRWLPAHLAQPLQQVLKAAQSQVPAMSGSSIRCHGDCHAGNLLCNERLTLLDLDDALQGPPITDFYLLLSGDRHDQLVQLDVLLEQYENFFHLPQSQLAWLEALKLRRMITYMAWLDLRWGDAAFQQAFPWFSQASYWQQQVSELEQQVKRLDLPALSLGLSDSW